MIDAGPDATVAEAEYVRLLGYPPGFVLAGRAAELAGQARAWYARHGRPWVYARRADRVEVGPTWVRIDGVAFTARRLQTMLQRTDAHAVMLVAVGAGPEIDVHAAELWRDERPDEYFFLDVYAGSVVEHLIAKTGARLCEWADTQALAVLPHDSPGYPDWHVGEQPRLLDLLKTGCAPRDWPGPIEALDTGALRPTKSQLVVSGLTYAVDRLDRRAGTLACVDCLMEACAYRRSPYTRRWAPAADKIGVGAGDEPTVGGAARGMVHS